MPKINEFLSYQAIAHFKTKLNLSYLLSSVKNLQSSYKPFLLKLFIYQMLAINSYL